MWSSIRAGRTSDSDRADAWLLQARKTMRHTLYKLINDTRAREAAGESALKEEFPQKGVKHGSFLHLLIHATNRETGKPFTDLQVRCSMSAVIV